MESPTGIWRRLIEQAAESIGTPCYVARWRPVAEGVAALDALSTGAVRVRSWFSFKTHPLPPLALQWLQSGRGIEVVSESELLTVQSLGASADGLLVNGVAKHGWLNRYPIPRLRVHFDSRLEVEELTEAAVAGRWRTGVRLHAPDECDARDPRFGGQFGMTQAEAVDALHALRKAGVDVEGVHFHLGQKRHGSDAYLRAVHHVARVCEDAAFHPRYVDLGGGLPSRADAAEALNGLERAIAAARGLFAPSLEEIWLENGRYITEPSSALAVRIVDIKEREDSRYLICDGGRSNHALAADKGPHPMMIVPPRTGATRLTTICGPTCMTDDVLARLPLPADIAVGDVIAWMDAGAYHLPWETRFSHGLCAVAWCDAADHMSLARERERPEAWAQQWTLNAA